MEAWEGWPVERLIYLFLAAAFLVTWAQLSLFHWRGAFRSKSMWGPVLFTPLLVIIALVHGFARGDIVGITFVVLFAIGVVEGLLGIVLHTRGVAEQVGGVNMRNLMAGPPVLLPVAYAAFSALGLLAYYWYDITGVA